ncbi:MAG: ATP-binding protein [Bacteroidales bacterium]|nr:ATP-binding protein [Bacteroidales bacterium]
MKQIFKYFFKSHSFDSNLESFRSRTLLLFLLTGLMLLIAFMIKTTLSGTYNSLYIQFVFLIILIASLILMKTGKHQLVGNMLSLLIVFIEIASTFFNFSGAESYNFFVDEFYLLLAFLLFSAMFASRFILITNSILITATAITAFIIKKNDFPPEIIEELKLGLNVYILVILIIFGFSYLYTHTILKAIKEISDSAFDTEEKNIQLEENAKLLQEQQFELIKAKEKAEESDRLKSSFLANMSHEIRTPMNSVLGFTTILKDSGLNEKQSEFVKIIESSGNHLLDLINDIIDISELESNIVKINNDKIKLNNLLNETAKVFEANLLNDNKDVKIITIPGFDSGNDIIYSDTKRLRQILINLIGNSIKFTSSGTVKISYILKNEELHFKVEDTGIGISEKELPIVFDRFRQADETTTKQYGGTGLGLAISKACVKLLGGEISVKSVKDKGSIFSFTIPYKPKDISI